MACLSKKPESRPATATELERLLAEIEVGPWTEEQAEQWWGLHPPA